MSSVSFLRVRPSTGSMKRIQEGVESERVALAFDSGCPDRGIAQHSSAGLARSCLASSPAPDMHRKSGHPRLPGDLRATLSF